MTLSGYRIPTLVPNTMTLNFAAGPDPIPTYSLADLRACIEVLAPPDLVRFMNEYLSAMTDIIQEQGGFVRRRIRRAARRSQPCAKRDRRRVALLRPSAQAQP